MSVFHVSLPHRLCIRGGDKSEGNVGNKVVNYNEACLLKNNIRFYETSFLSVTHTTRFLFVTDIQTENKLFLQMKHLTNTERPLYTTLIVSPTKSTYWHHSNGSAFTRCVGDTFPPARLSNVAIVCVIIATLIYRPVSSEDSEERWIHRAPNVVLMTSHS